MPVTTTINESISCLGFTFPSKRTVTTDGCVPKLPTVTAAKTGTLSTRTDDNTGTLTMSSGHGFTDGQRLDIYWTGGSRRGVVIGTVATNSVPIDLGSGDNLPTATTAITAKVPTEEVFVVTGDNALGVLLYSDQPGQIVFCTSNNTEVKAYSIGGAVGAQQSFFWDSERSATNPLAGGAVTKAFFSHSSSSASADMRAIVLIN